MIFIKVDGNLYPAVVTGRVANREWDNRESKHIKLEMGFADAKKLFKNGVAWSIVEKVFARGMSIDDEGDTTQGELEEKQIEYDNSEYCVLGDIVVHSDGTCTVAMGKPTETEKMQAQLANVITEEELTAAYNEGVNSL